MSQPAVAVVILNWNGTSFLQKFLPSVTLHSEEATVYVVDNGSDDQPDQLLNQQFPQVKWIKLGQNYGFCGGYNRSIPQLTEEWVVLLNSDVEVSPGWLKPLVNALKSDQQLVAVQPTILSFSQPNYFEYAGAAGGFIDFLGYPFCRGRLFHTLEEDQGQYDSEHPFPVFWASGACMMVRREAFIEAGGFDEAFFAHMEEIDLCWRFQHQGLKVAVVTSSKVFHVGGGTLSVESPRKRFLNHRNNLLMLYKNLPQHEVWKIILQRLLLDGITGLMELARGRPSMTLAVIKAHFDFYRLKSLYSTKSRDFKFPQTVYQKSVVWEYFVKGKKRFGLLNWSPIPGS